MPKMMMSLRVRSTRKLIIIFGISLFMADQF